MKIKNGWKYIFVLLLMSVLFLFAGCWNYREIESLSIVSGFAIDAGQQGNKYHCTFELADMSKGSREGGAESKLIEAEGNSIFDCARNAIQKSKNRLYFSDCKIVIINKDLAGEGIHSLLDWMSRDAEVRITMDLLISKQNTAKEILAQKAITDKIVSYEIANMLANSASVLAKNPVIKIYQANNMLNGKGISLILPAVEVEQIGETKNLELDGTAIFKEDKLIGFLDSKESKALLFIKNMINGGLMLTNLDSDMPDITLEVFDSHTKVTPVFSGDTVLIDISFDVEAGVAEDQSETGYVSEEGIKKIEEAACQTLKENVTRLIDKMQKQYDSDIFGFGSLVYQNNYKFWEQNGSNWDAIFKNLPVEVSAEVHITSTAFQKSNNKVGE